jgi:hypothetical protein
VASYPSGGTSVLGDFLLTAAAGFVSRGEDAFLPACLAPAGTSILAKGFS